MFSQEPLSTAIALVVSAVLYRNASWFALHILLEERCAPLLRLMAFSIPMGTLHSCVNGYYFAPKKTGHSCCCPASGTECQSRCFLWHLSHSDGTECAGNSYAGCGRLTGRRAGFHDLFSPGNPPGLSKAWLPSEESPLSCKRPKRNTGPGLSSDLQPASCKCPSQHRVCTDSWSSAAFRYGQRLCSVCLWRPHWYGPSSYSFSFRHNQCRIYSPSSLCGRESGRRQSKGHTQSYPSLRKYCLILGFLSTAFFFFAGDFLGLILFKNEFAATFIKTLSFICPCLYLSGTLSGILNGLGAANQSFILNTLGLGVRIAFVFFVIPEYGILGYLWGLIVSEILVTGLSLCFLREYFS